MLQFLKNVLATIVGVFVSVFLLVVVGIGVVSVVLSTVVDNKKTPSKNMVLELNLNYTLVEKADENPLEEWINKNSNTNIGLDKIINEIYNASSDANVKGILVKPGLFDAGFASIEEIREALTHFKKQGKFVYAYSEILTEKNYYLASVCDSIFLNPSGEIVLDGLSSNILLYKGLLDKVGVKMELFKVGTHKGAAEVYTQDQLSEENKSQIQRYLDVSFNQFCEDIAKDRALNKDSLMSDIQAFIVQSPALAVEKKIIDKLAYEDEVATIIKSKVGKKPEDKMCFTSFSDYYGMNSKDMGTFSSDNVIAFVYIAGEITNVSNNDNEAGCKSLLKSLRKARFNKDVKALVVRINSPGGSAYGSDQIWREIMLIKKTKPVIVSMGDVAASGGYYIAAPADSIFASKYTLTGSIGVFALYPNMKELFNEHLGLKFETLKTGEYSDFGTLDKELTISQKQIIQKGVDRVYNNFTQVVKQGRGLDSSHVESIAQGKVWIGPDAKNVKLIDGYASIRECVHIASHKAGLKKNDFRMKYLPEKDNSINSLFQIKSILKEEFLKNEMGMFYSYYKAVNEIHKETGVKASLPYTLSID